MGPLESTTKERSIKRGKKKKPKPHSPIELIIIVNNASKGLKER